MPDNITAEAIQFSQTGRKGWVLTLHPQDLVKLLPPRGPEQLSLFTDTNRPITPRHLGAIESFLTDTPGWAFPNITLAATPGALTTDGNQITLTPENLKILDGQHRLEAMANLLHRWKIQASDESKRQAKELTAQQIPITIFEVRNNQEQRQLFAWFARSRPIEAAVREYFDDSDPYNRAAKAAMEDSTVLNGRINWRSRRVPAKEADLLSLANLKDIATTIHIGVTRTPKALDRKIIGEPEPQQALQKQLTEFFDKFLPSCRTHYEFLADPKNIRAKIPQSRQASYALNPLVVRLFANTWARWTEIQNPPTTQRLASYISSLNLNLASPDNDIQANFQLVNEKNRLHGLRHKSWNEATSAILKNARD